MEVNIQLSPSHRKWVLVSCLLQQFAFLAICFGYGLGLPQIVEGFGKSEYFGFVGVAYSLTQAIVAPIIATVGDRVGRKWLNVVSLILMCVFLAMTYFASSFVMFLISWALCGVAVGGFMSGSFLIVMDIYERKDWGKMSGSLVTALSAGMIAGPVVGGMLVDAGSLRGIFLFVIPFFLAAAVIQIVLFPNKKSEAASSRFDGLGVLLLIFSLVPLVVVLNFAGKFFAWGSVIAIALVVVMVVASVLLYRRETRIEQPAFALGALKNKIVLLSCVLCFLTAAYSVLSAGFLIYFAQAVLHVTATSSATLMLPQVIVSFFLPMFIGRWLSGNNDRYRTTLWLMGITLGVPLIGISLMTAETGMLVLYVLMAIGGVGYTLLNNCLPPFMTMSVSPAEMGAANGCKSFFTTLGTAVMGSVFGMMLGMFESFPVAISRVFLLGGIFCLLVTPIILLCTKKEARPAPET